jgi:hypothetical protein
MSVTKKILIPGYNCCKIYKNKFSNNFKNIWSSKLNFLKAETVFFQKKLYFNCFMIDFLWQKISIKGILEEK